VLSWYSMSCSRLSEPQSNGRLDRSIEQITRYSETSFRGSDLSALWRWQHHQARLLVRTQWEAAVRSNAATVCFWPQGGIAAGFRAAPSQASHTVVRNGLVVMQPLPSSRCVALHYWLVDTRHLGMPLHAASRRGAHYVQ
jgi:hypothetical protein